MRVAVDTWWPHSWGGGGGGAACGPLLILYFSKW